VKVPDNWLPRRKLFDYDYFLYAFGLFSAIPPDNFIIVCTFDLHSFFTNLTHLDFTSYRGVYQHSSQDKGQVNQG